MFIHTGKSKIVGEQDGERMDILDLNLEILVVCVVRRHIQFFDNENYKSNMSLDIIAIIFI